MYFPARGKVYFRARDFNPALFNREGRVDVGTTVRQNQPAPGIAAHLFIKAGPNGGEVHPLSAAELVAGRGAECQLRLDDPFVSRRHFRLRREASAYILEDLGSANCTVVNGVPAKLKKLESGDEIYVGSTRISVLMGASTSGLLPGVGGTTRVLNKRSNSIESRFEMFGSCAAMQHVFEFIERIGPLDTTALITGESGTGKELVARALHQKSACAGGPMVAVNSAAIPRELAESELFGHEKGAFTGASSLRLGKFELANGGTLFLDEIGELPLETQAKLLRVLEERKVTRLGGSRDYSVKVRVISATHQDLHALVQSGRFRQDLLYRLEVVSLRLPPLRERAEDIELLARHFLASLREKLGRRIDDFTPEALAKMRAYRWPGNVRELKNAVERAAILCEGPMIEASDVLTRNTAAMRRMTQVITQPEKDGFQPLDEMLQSVARPHIERALSLAGGNKKKAADLLGVPRSSLYDIAKKYGIRLK